jgi:hypothetical protein
MEVLYSFVDAVQEVPSKLAQFEDIVKDILNQTVECAIFIREYTGQGFRSEYFNLHDVQVLIKLSPERMVHGIFLGDNDRIISLSQNLVGLKEKFQSGVAVQTVLASSRIQLDITTLCKRGKHLNCLAQTDLHLVYSDQTELT